jgi:hypothetical protein
MNGLTAVEAKALAYLQHYGAAIPFTSGTRLEILPVLVAAFAAFFYLAYGFWSVLPITASKGAKLRGTFSSCTMSIFHGIVATVMATYELKRAWPVDVAATNTARLDLVMTFSTAYMLVDLFCFLLPLTPNDFLFVGHHIMTATYMMSSVLLGRGGVSVAVLMALGEATSIFQNSWYIARDLRKDSPLAAAAFKRLSPAYTVAFVIVRTLIGPPAITWLARRLVLTDRLPFALRSYWAACAVLGVTGSQLWTYRLVRGLRKHMRATQVADQELKKAR